MLISQLFIRYRVMAKFKKQLKQNLETEVVSQPAPVAKPVSSVRRFFRFLGWSFVGFVLAFHMMVVALLYVWQTQPVTNSMFMILHRISTFSGVEQTWINAEKISTHVKKAVIASEDANFVRHAGFDIQGIENAIHKNRQAGEISAGGSTISQQLAKNLFLFPQRSYIRKAEEALITLIMEQMWTKERILTVYLNVAEFGNGIYGIEQASQHYFHKSAKKLTKRESAWLISMLPNPKYYQKNRTSKRLQYKTAIILRRMDSAILPE